MVNQKGCEKKFYVGASSRNVEVMSPKVAG